MSGTASMDSCLECRMDGLRMDTGRSAASDQLPKAKSHFSLIIAATMFIF